MPGWNCPSSPLSTNASGQSPTFNNAERGQTHDYVGISGATWDQSTRCSVQTGYGGIFCENGMLAMNVWMRMRDVADGTSNTMIVGEQSGRMGGKDIRASYQGGWEDSPPAQTQPNHQFGFLTVGLWHHNRSLSINAGTAVCGPLPAVITFMMPTLF